MYKNNVKLKHQHHNDIDLSDDLVKIKEVLTNATRDLKDKANEALIQSIKNAKKKTTTAQHKALNYLTEKPIKTLGIAVLAGIAIGCFLRK